MGKSSIDSLLDEIQAIMKRKKMSLADLARELGLMKVGEMKSGKTPSAYIQLYKWVVSRQHVPSAETALKLQVWRTKQQRMK